MIVSDRWDGSGAPFQGDRRLRLAALPAGARVGRAVLRVLPVSAEGGEPFVERLSLAPDAAPGASASQQRRDGTPSWAEIDLRGRRTLHAVEGRNLAGAALHVDLGGGVFVPVDAAGGIAPSPAAAFTVASAAGGGDLEGPDTRPGVAGTRLRLVRSASSAPEVDAVLVRSVPSFVSVRLGDDPPFWVHPGDLSAPAETPDFGPVLARWIAANGFEREGYVAVPLTIHTQTLGRFRLEVEVEAAMEAPLVPVPLSEATFPFDFSTHTIRPPATPTWAGDLSVRVPAGARFQPGGTRMRLRGAFGETRVVSRRGPTGIVDPEQARGRALVSTDYAQAQQVPSGAEALVTAVDLLLKPLARVAELQVDLRADEGGRPGAPLLPRPLRLKVAQGEQADRPVWASAALTEPFHVDAGTPYWIVVQAVAGEAEWVGYPHECEAAARLELTGLRTPPPVPPPLMNTVDGGMSWRSGGPMVALFRLRARPPRFTMPLAVEVGVGLDAVRVPLDRFGPLGRVDFALDDDSLAGAATAAARGGRRWCPAGEALADGDFEQWSAEGAGLGTLDAVELDGALPLRAASSPDGRWVYVLAARDGAPALLRVDVPGDLLMDETRLEGAFHADPHASALLVHPDGTRAYVLLQPPMPAQGLSVHVVDLDTAEAVGPPRSLAPLVAAAGAGPARIAAAVSPDGQAIYVAARSRVYALDVAALERGGPVRELRATVGGALHLEGTATCLALSPGGGLLVVGTAGQEGLLFLVHLAGNDPLAPALLQPETPIRLPAAPSAVAVSPDGALALVAYRAGDARSGSGAVLVDLQRGGLLNVTSKTAVDATAAAMAADGSRAYVGGTGTLAVVDLERRSMLVHQPPGAAGELLALAPTPQGDRVFALIQPPSGGAAVRSASVGTRRPVRWTVTGPVSLGAPRGAEPRGVVLGTPGAPKPDPALLSQTLAVRAGCRYVFSFHAVASRGSSSVAELFWVGSRGELLDPSRVPVAEADAFTGAPPPDGRPLRPHRRWLSAPPGATRVEVRFRVPSGAAEVARASLLATADLAVNGDFRLPLLGEDGGWRVMPDARAAVVRAAPGGGAAIRGVGPGAAELSQEVALEGGTPLDLRFEAWATASADGQAPELRVRWMDADGRPAGQPATMRVLPDDFPAHPLRLQPPEGAVGAAIALVVPARATLRVTHLSVVPVPMVEVPFRFIAEAPGELTVTEAWAVYELPEAGAADARAGDDGGARGAGDPGSGGGDGHGADGGGGDAAGGGSGEGGDGGCHVRGPGTDADGASAQPRMRPVPLARPRVPGGGRWLRPGMVVATPTPPAAPAPAPAPAADTITPVSDVRGVGVVRERRLATAGILTAEKLALATPETLTRADPALSPTVARAIITEAARLVEARKQ